jgi:hypothetical protein
MELKVNEFSAHRYTFPMFFAKKNYTFPMFPFVRYTEFALLYILLYLLKKLRYGKV